MTAQEYQLKKLQIARLKDLLGRRFMTKEALECMRAILDCEKYEKELLDKNADEFRNNN